ncbi:MAG: inner membrane CreD family protein, partial [Bacteroidales bacterium]|nr:inner membrane CreD family protein [Bacteroidales bacterium]
MKLIFKIALIGFLSIMMLIPLAMIRGQIRDRQDAAYSCK